MQKKWAKYLRKYTNSYRNMTYFRDEHFKWAHLTNFLTPLHPEFEKIKFFKVISEKNYKFSKFYGIYENKIVKFSIFQQSINFSRFFYIFSFIVNFIVDTNKKIHIYKMLWISLKLSKILEIEKFTIFFLENSVTFRKDLEFDQK